PERIACEVPIYRPTFRRQIGTVPEERLVRRNVFLQLMLRDTACTCLEERLDFPAVEHLLKRRTSHPGTDVTVAHKFRRVIVGLGDELVKGELAVCREARPMLRSVRFVVREALRRRFHMRQGRDRLVVSTGFGNEPTI